MSQYRILIQDTGHKHRLPAGSKSVATLNGSECINTEWFPGLSEIVYPGDFGAAHLALSQLKEVSTSNELILS